MLVQIERPGREQGPADPTPAILRLGFRPFYLLGAAFAALAVPLWIAAVAGAGALPRGLDAYRWHQHEMVFGFALAIVTGFLFTAARNWTGLATPRGGALAAFCALWLLARGAWFAGAATAGVALDAIFALACAGALGRVLLQARNRRNYFVGALYVVLAAADVAYVLAANGALGATTPDACLRFALYLVVTLTFVIGGRVIPGFTSNAVRGLAQWRDPRVDRAAIAAGVAAFACELAGLAWPTVAAASIAALLHAARLWGWRPLATRGRPILWILHASYAWIPVGFALMAAYAAGAVARPLALHAFTVGTVGGLIVGMVTRTALGHTGRPLTAGRSEVAMYWLVQLAAAARVAGPLAAPGAMLAWEIASAVLWSAAFALYVLVYAPRLAAPRVDGAPG